MKPVKPVLNKNFSARKNAEISYGFLKEYSQQMDSQTIVHPAYTGYMNQQTGKINKSQYNFDNPTTEYKKKSRNLKTLDPSDPGYFFDLSEKDAQIRQSMTEKMVEFKKKVYELEVKLNQDLQKDKEKLDEISRLRSGMELPEKNDNKNLTTNR